jgi:hypothetical protein
VVAEEVVHHWVPLRLLLKPRVSLVHWQIFGGPPEFTCFLLMEVFMLNMPSHEHPTLLNNRAVLNL